MSWTCRPPCPVTSLPYPDFGTISRDRAQLRACNPAPPIAGPEGFSLDSRAVVPTAFGSRSCRAHLWPPARVASSLTKRKRRAAARRESPGVERAPGGYFELRASARRWGRVSERHPTKRSVECRGYARISPLRDGLPRCSSPGNQKQRCAGSAALPREIADPQRKQARIPGRCGPVLVLTCELRSVPRRRR